MPTPQSDIDGVLSFEGTPFGGFQTFTGGEESGEVLEDRQPGAKYADKDVTGATISNITETRSWVESRDRPLYNRLKGRTGMKGSAGRIVRDEHKNISDVESFAVKLVRFAGPEGDSNATTAKGMFTVEVAVTGRA
jgi:hypothetical protein